MKIREGSHFWFRNHSFLYQRSQKAKRNSTTFSTASSSSSNIWRIYPVFSFCFFYKNPLNRNVSVSSSKLLRLKNRVYWGKVDGKTFRLWQRKVEDSWTVPISPLQSTYKKAIIIEKKGFSRPVFQCRLGLNKCPLPCCLPFWFLISWWSKSKTNPEKDSCVSKIEPSGNST